MASVRDKLLSPIARLRGVADTKLGLRRFDVYLRRVRASDGRGGRGSTETITDVALTERPRIREASSQDVVQGGGRVEVGDLIMDRITPQNDAATVGIAPGVIKASPMRGDEQVLVVLVGPGMLPYVAGPPPSGGSSFTVVSAEEIGNFEFRYVLRPYTGKR